ncbi:MAG: hypothetical protein ACLPPF_15245 [Rhodomicrobium sp.]
MSKDTKLRLWLAVMVFMMLQAVVFGFGMTAVLYYPTLTEHAGFFWVPLVIAATSIISAAFSWWIAPHLRARYWRSEGEHSFMKWAGGGHLGSDWGHEHAFNASSQSTTANPNSSS